MSSSEKKIILLRLPHSPEWNSCEKILNNIQAIYEEAYPGRLTVVDTTDLKIIRDLAPDVVIIADHRLNFEHTIGAIKSVLSKPIDWGDLDRTLHLVAVGIAPPKTTPAPTTDTPAPPPLPANNQNAAESSNQPPSIKGIDPKKWAEMVDLLGNAEARGLCLHGILDAEEMVGQIGELLAENPHRPGKQGDYFRLVHTLEGLLGNIGALEWASLCHRLQQDEFSTHRLEWLELIRDGLTNLYDSLQN